MKTVLIGDKKISELQSELGANTWPEFIQHDKVVNKYWSGLYDDFLGFQFALMEDDKLLGIGNSIPLHWNQPLSDLPDGGLDWALEKANVDFRMNLDHNILVGVQILIDPGFQNQGLSYQMLDIMKGIATKTGLTSIALPVRPSLKSKYPLIQMEDYINWKNKEGLPFDPWIRVHIKAGGKIIKTCNKSMEISGTIKEWEKWTNTQFQTSGDYIIDKALVPIRVNVEKNVGNYIEPNVWIVHTVK
jgi:GNAT superfamily N-acetyltransferase